MDWPPKVGEPLPRAKQATGIQRKLLTYSLDRSHEDGGSKARGFETILGITFENVEYLEGAIQTGIIAVRVSAVRENLPHGMNCVVTVPVRGLGQKKGRVVGVRTVWSLAAENELPRMVSAFPKP